MDQYARETKAVLKRFLRRQISFPSCISALDSALARFIPRLKGDQIATLRELMLTNNATVMEEMENRTATQI